MSAQDRFVEKITSPTTTELPTPWAEARRSIKTLLAHLTLAERAVEGMDDEGLASALAAVKDDADEILYYARGGS